MNKAFRMIDNKIGSDFVQLYEKMKLKMTVVKPEEKARKRPSTSKNETVNEWATQQGGPQLFFSLEYKCLTVTDQTSWTIP